VVIAQLAGDAKPLAKPLAKLLAKLLAKPLYVL